MKFFSNKQETNLDSILEMAEKDGKLNPGLSILEDDEPDQSNLSGTQTPVEYFEQPKKKKGRPRKIKNTEETSELYPGGKIQSIAKLNYQSSQES